MARCWDGQVGSQKKEELKKKKSENLAKALFDYFLDEPDQKN